MISILNKIWRYIKCVVILKKEISFYTKNKFSSFGVNSIINRPYKQLSNIDYIKIGNDTTILSGCRLAVYGTTTGNDTITITIGNHCYLGYNLTILACKGSPVVIEDDVLLASDITITSENHGINPESSVPYMNQDLNGKTVVIGRGCWIGEKAIILPGVKIGQKSIIGAGSVVTNSIKEYSIAVGNPAKIIKQYNFETHLWEKV